MAKLPKNIATMTDAERDNWWMSLSGTDADKFSDRTFIVREYNVRPINCDGDSEDVYFADTIDEARRMFDGETTAVLEYVTQYRSVADGDLAEQEYETLDVKGNREWLSAGGWIE